MLARVSAARDEILAFLDAELETHRYRDDAPIGMQVIGAEQVERVASAVSSTLEVFDRAAVEGAQLLLVHHGMFWDNEPRVIGRHMKRRLERLFAADITLAAYHLPLDGHQLIGNNARLAEELRVRVDGWFSEHGGIPLAVHGILAAAVPLQTLAERVAEVVGRVPIAFPGGPERVRTLRDLLRATGRDRAGGCNLRRGRAGDRRAAGGFPGARARAGHVHRLRRPSRHRDAGRARGRRAPERALRHRARLPRRAEPRLARHFPSEDGSFLPRHPPLGPCPRPRAALESPHGRECLPMVTASEAAT